MKKLLIILFLMPLVSKSQIRTAYHFPTPIVIIDSVPGEDPEEPGRPPDSVTLTYLTLPEAAPATYSNMDGIVIENKRFSNTNPLVNGGKCLQFINCTNVTVRNCYIGSSVDNGIEIERGRGFTITNNLFANNRSGVYAAEGAQDIYIYNNECINPHGPFPRGQFVQFNGVTTSATGQSIIRKNRVRCFLGESYPEDIINMFNSSGRPGAPILIDSNYLWGGGPSMTGGGILIGESSGDYNSATNNKAYNTGNYLFSISGGSNNLMTGNKGYSDLNYSSYDDWSNVGYVIWAQMPYSLPFDNVTFNNNTGFTNTARFGYNPIFYPDVVTGTITYDNDDWYGAGEEATYLAILDFPTPLITFVSEDDLWKIRDESQQFRVAGWLHRPTANAGINQSISINTATLSGSATTSNGASYRWVQVSGPNTAIMSAPTSATNNLSSLVSGVYVFRLEVTDNGGSADADWMVLSVTL